jgi:DNA modification methylase
VDKAFRKIKKQERRQELVQEALNNNLINKLHEGAQLNQGDFVEKSKDIPDESIDLIFTDPPYEKESIPPLW